MFLGIGNLVNPAAIQLTKANAYQAAKVVLGLNADSTTLRTIAERYTAFAIPRLNRAASVPQILSDLDFSRFVSEGKDGPPQKTIDKVDKLLGSSSYGLGDSLFLGIPNFVLYGGLGYLGYRYYKKKKATGGLSFFKPQAVASPALPSPVAAPVAANPRRKRRNCGCKRSR